MAEVLILYDIQLRGPDGRSYGARSCARERADELWEGWIEFEPLDGGDAIRTGRETTQPNRGDVMYWAGGLTAGYLDGALLRTLRPAPAVEARRDARARPAYAGPRPRGEPRGAASVTTTAVLDPFHVYAEGADVLRGQLRALSAGQLGNIIKACYLTSASPEEIDHMSERALIELIVSAVERRSASQS